MTLDIIQAAMRQLEASGQPVSANTLVALVGGSKRDVLALLRQARALAGVTTGPVQPDDEDDDAAPDAPSAPPDTEPVDVEREALAAQIKALQAELKALDEAALPPLWEMPGWEPVTELASFQTAYREAMDTPCTTYTGNDPVVIRRAEVQFDFAQRRQIVQRLLRRARQYARLARVQAGQDVDSDYTRVLQADMVEIVKFVGKAEAQRLLANTETPVWTLEG